MSRSGTENAIKGATEWLIPALDFGKNFDPGSRFERPAGLVCSRRDPGPSSDHTEQQTFEGFGRSPDRFAAYADSQISRTIGFDASSPECSVYRNGWNRRGREF